MQWLYPYYATGPASTVAAPAAANFLEALRTRLRGLSELADLTDVYLTTAAPGAPFPYLLIHLLDEDPEVNTSESYYELVMMQYDLLSLDADEAYTLGRAARQALLPKAENPPLEFQDGYEMTRLPGRAKGPYAETQGMPGGETVWRYRFEFTHMIGRD